jgi:hypothetical protein
VKIKSSLDFSASSFYQEKDEGLRQEKRIYHSILVGVGNIMLMECRKLRKMLVLHRNLKLIRYCLVELNGINLEANF